MRLGISERVIRISAPAYTTADEAKAVTKLMDKHVSQRASQRAKSLGGAGAPALGIILVTSAYHMPRAQCLFENAGLLVMPYPVGFQVDTGKQTNIMDFTPTADAFRRTEMIWREFIGRLYYRVTQG